MFKKPTLLQIIILGFIAGFVATILFHQEFLELLFQLHIIPKRPYSMTPVPPFGIPSFLSLAFWGGVWGIAGFILFRNSVYKKRFWCYFTLFGGFLPPLIAVLVVFPLKHIDTSHIMEPSFFTLIFVVNAIWGAGTALIIKLWLKLSKN